MQPIRRKTGLVLGLVSSLLCSAIAQEKSASPPETPQSRNPAVTPEERAADLVPRLTLEEKVAQISGGGQARTEVLDTTGTFTPEQARQIFSRWWDPDLVLEPRRATILRNAVQRYLKEKTKFGIPDLFMGEAQHGFIEYGSTSFPQALGLA